MQPIVYNKTIKVKSAIPIICDALDESDHEQRHQYRLNPTQQLA